MKNNELTILEPIWVKTYFQELLLAYLSFSRGKEFSRFQSVTILQKVVVLENYL